MLLDLSQIQQAFDKVQLSSDGRGYFNHDACRECKGKYCCQHFACVYVPEDFDVLNDDSISKEQKVLYLFNQIRESGNISMDLILFNDSKWGPINPDTHEPDIDKIRKDDGYLMLRASSKGRPIIDFQIFLEKGKDFPCINWSLENGCNLSKESRPFSGRMLKPVVLEGYPIEKRYRCFIKDEDYDYMAIEWSKYQDIMFELYLKLEEQFH